MHHPLVVPLPYLVTLEPLEHELQVEDRYVETGPHQGIKLLDDRYKGLQQLLLTRSVQILEDLFLEDVVPVLPVTHRVQVANHEPVRVNGRTYHPDASFVCLDVEVHHAPLQLVSHLPRHPWSYLRVLTDRGFHGQRACHRYVVEDRRNNVLTQGSVLLGEHPQGQ